MSGRVNLKTCKVNIDYFPKQVKTSKSDQLLFLQSTRKAAETNPPSFIHKPGETGRAQGGPVCPHLFSFQDWASSPAGREMSCRVVIVGHSARREWAAEVQLCFSFSFLAPGPRSPPWPDSERPECSSLEAGRDAVCPAPRRLLCWNVPDTKARPGCASRGGGGLPLLRLVGSGHGGESSRFHGCAAIGFGGRGRAECFRLSEIAWGSPFLCRGRHGGRELRPRDP